MNNWSIRKAKLDDVDVAWTIVQSAIAKRAAEGSQQWQDGYPNIESLKGDVANDTAFLLLFNEQIVGYAALIFDIEPAYEEIEGKWLSNTPYGVIHRMATKKIDGIKGVGTTFLQLLERETILNGYNSLKVDTNFDNTAMLLVFEKLGYKYCGEVYFRGSARRAYEKQLG